MDRAYRLSGATAAADASDMDNRCCCVSSTSVLAKGANFHRALTYFVGRGERLVHHCPLDRQLIIGAEDRNPPVPRGWTDGAIQEAIRAGTAVNAITGNWWASYTLPKATTGQSVVIDDVTGDVI